MRLDIRSVERPNIMKRHKVLHVLTTVLIVVGSTLLISGLSMLIIDKYSSYSSRLRGTLVNLNFSRESVRLFFEENGRFPKSLHELNEYGKKFPGEIKWRFGPKESISNYLSDLSEHDVLDGTGGLYYSSETGVVKINLTKPLKAYWRFYFGTRRNEVPADW
jgi:hypothetical protein